MTAEIREIADKKGLKDFLNVPFDLYREDKNWVAPLFLERHDHFNTRKNPYFLHADVQLFAAHRNGKAVGRISAQHDRLRLEHHKDATGQFGFFECEDDSNTVAGLFQAASGWLKARGLRRMLGPFNFSINDEMGLLVDGFSTRPNMMMGHALPRYAAALEQIGLRKEKDVIAYFTDHTGQLPPALLRVMERAKRGGLVTTRHLEKKHLARDIAIVMSIFNDAWSDNWGFVPFTPEELTKLGNDLKMLVSEGSVVIADYKGEPVAMAVTLPNLNDWIAGMNGRLLPFNWAKLALNVIRKRPTSIRMPLMGVRKKYQDTLVGSALAVTVIEEIRRFHIPRGVTSCEMSWILEENRGMRHIIEELGGVPYKTYRIYGKDL